MIPLGMDCSAVSKVALPRVVEATGLITRRGTTLAPSCRRAGWGIGRHGTTSDVGIKPSRE